MPSAGYAGAADKYIRGYSHGNICEVDIVDRYVASLVDELNEGGIRHRVVNTRKAPGTALEARFSGYLDWQLPIECAVGINESKKIKQQYNSSFVYGNANVPRIFLDELSDVVGHWGALYVHGHKTAAPRGQPQYGIRIEPFIINGPSAEEYARRLDKLGRDIGRFLVDFLRSRGAHAVFSISKNAPMKAVK